MLGLIIKDFLQLKRILKALLGLCILYTLIAFAQDSPDMLVTFSVIICTISCMNSLMLAIYQKGFNQNQLKIFAAITMTLDHIGAELLPQYEILRYVGRLAFPLFAYFIFEGCHYTRNKCKYLGQIFFLGLICVIGYYVFSGELYGNVLITFSVSISIIYCLKYLEKNWDCFKREHSYGSLFLGISALTISIGASWLLCENIYIDYGLWGILLPVFAEAASWISECVFGRRRKSASVIGFALGLLALSINIGGYQYLGLISILFLILYNGSRGEWKMKYFFYWFYPLHLVLIGLLGMLFNT